MVDGQGLSIMLKLESWALIERQIETITCSICFTSVLKNKLSPVTKMSAADLVSRPSPYSFVPCDLRNAFW